MFQVPAGQGKGTEKEVTSTIYAWGLRLQCKILTSSRLWRAQAAGEKIKGKKREKKLGHSWAMKNPVSQMMSIAEAWGIKFEMRNLAANSFLSTLFFEKTHRGLSGFPNLSLLKKKKKKTFTLKAINEISWVLDQGIKAVWTVDQIKRALLALTRILTHL